MRSRRSKRCIRTSASLVVCDGEPPRWTTGLKVTEKWEALETLPRRRPRAGRERASLELSDAGHRAGATQRAVERLRSGRELSRGARRSRVAVASASRSSPPASSRFGFSGRAVVGAFFACVLVLLSAIDLDRRLIPNVIVLPALAICLAAQIALYPDHALEWVLASFLAALALFLPLLVVPTGMGMGDVKLAALLGAVLGRSVVARSSSASSPAASSRSPSWFGGAEGAQEDDRVRAVPRVRRARRLARRRTLRDLA